MKPFFPLLVSLNCGQSRYTCLHSVPCAILKIPVCAASKCCTNLCPYAVSAHSQSWTYCVCVVCLLWYNLEDSALHGVYPYCQPTPNTLVYILQVLTVSKSWIYLSRECICLPTQNTLRLHCSTTHSYTTWYAATTPHLQIPIELRIL
jgi:hypothetical protein